MVAPRFLSRYFLNRRVCPTHHWEGERLGRPKGVGLCDKVPAGEDVFGTLSSHFW